MKFKLINFFLLYFFIHTFSAYGGLFNWSFTTTNGVDGWGVLEVDESSIVNNHLNTSSGYRITSMSGQIFGHAFSQIRPEFLSAPVWDDLLLNLKGDTEQLDSYGICVKYFDNWGQSAQVQIFFSPANNQDYCDITQSFGKFLATRPLPVITSQPTSSTNNINEAHTFSVETSSFPVFYQWTKDGIILPYGTNSTLTFTNIKPVNIGNYAVTITDIYSNRVTSSNAMLTLNGVDTGVWQGLVAYYPFNGNANDASGNGNNPNVISAISSTADRFGQTGLAYHFDTSYILYTNLGINLTGPYTLSFWGKLNAFKDYGSFMELNMETACNGNPQLFETLSSVRYSHCSSGGGLPFGASSDLTNSWHQFTASVAAGGLTSIYSDGALISVTSEVWPMSTVVNFTVGASGNTASPMQFGNIDLDDIRIYNRALSSNEVVQLYAIDSVPPLQITQDLTNSTAVYGRNTTLSIQAASSSPVSYQWYWVPANNLGQQAGAYPQTFSGSGFVFIYGAMVTNGGYGYGNIPNVSFVGGGGSGVGAYSVVSNGVVTGITVTNAGSGYSSVPAIVIDSPNGLLFGQTNSSYTITNANQSSLGNYFVVVSSGSGSVTSSVVNLTLLYPAQIAAEPVGFTGAYHSSNSLSVMAAGTSPFAYQWAINGTNINAATNASYVISYLTQTNTGAYIVSVGNAYGSVTSSVANVYMSPALTSPFSGTVALWGQNTTLAVGAIGSGDLSYQWYFNGSPIPGAIGSGYGLGPIQFTNAGLYSVVVSSSYGSVTNQAYQVVVNAANVDIGLYPAVGISGTIGNSYIIQSTTDLSDTNSWFNETNIILNSVYQKWSDYSTMGSHKYYRVVPGQ